MLESFYLMYSRSFYLEGRCCLAVPQLLFLIKSIENDICLNSCRPYLHGSRDKSLDLRQFEGSIEPVPRAKVAVLYSTRGSGAALTGRVMIVVGGSSGLRTRAFKGECLGPLDILCRYSVHIRFSNLSVQVGVPGS